MILVDTYNVLHTPAALRSLHDEPTAGHLAVLLAAGRFRRDRAVLICDGAPPGKDWPERLGPSADRRAEFRFRVEGVEIVYAGPGRDADSLIERLIERDTAPRRLRVVSSDRRLIRAAKAARARPVAADGFMQTLLDDAERAGKRWTRPAFATEVPLSRSAVRYWHDLFDIDPADLPPDPAPNTPGPPEPRPKPAPRPATKPAPSAPPPADRAAPRSPPAAPVGPAEEPGSIDPLLLEAIEEWRGRLSLDDLDMSRWLGDDSNPPSRS